MQLLLCRLLLQALLCKSQGVWKEDGGTPYRLLSTPPVQIVRPEILGGRGGAGLPKAGVGVGWGGGG
jgi:hypothetical protein